MYVANCTRSDIAFAVNLLTRHSAAQQNVIGQELKISSDILQGTIDLGLFYQFDQYKAII
jgi:hypothetical protein